MYRISGLLIPLMLINHVLAENHWKIFGVSLSSFTYLIIILISFYLAYYSIYRQEVIYLFISWVICRSLGLIGLIFLKQLSFILIALLLFIVGALIYGVDHNRLHRQLTLYFSLSIPVMILQVLGVTQFVHYWNIAYAHTDAGLLIEEIGKFKDVPLFPTFLVEYEDLKNSIGQTRPVGLMYGSNPLSVILSIYTAHNISIERKSFIQYSDFIMIIMIVLTMSKLVFGVFILINLFYLVFGDRDKKVLVLKLILLFSMFLFLYYILFPGVVLFNFGKVVFMSAIMLRLGDLWRTLEVGMLSDTIEMLSFQYRPEYEFDSHLKDSYSGITQLLKNSGVGVVVLFLMSSALFYLSRVNKNKFFTWRIYFIILFVCLITQFAVPFYSSILYQILVGFSLYPLFKKLRISNQNNFMLGLNAK